MTYLQKIRNVLNHADIRIIENLQKALK